ncbi:uncharacterized protein BDW43DRAFT_310007 [Aspergillus alliaceus]|uniref:uncharacterized protein n=1 Tax=Petromyces alliaceus TaxID=209559 RepID=UPI0012A74CC7|nr:uncharacterized protein BDW43DRAFT_310007 [Aspergillus alliaceus]KAB8234748.1 hypothetical protein BDW43DRAFT_310007 [Aspergillus alliaceus]
MSLLALYFIVKSSAPDANQLKFPVVKYQRGLPDFVTRTVTRILYFVYKTKAFRILKVDGDLAVLPQTYLEELKYLDEFRLTPLDADSRDDFLQWMMELADNDFENDPLNLADGLMVIMALAVVHTTTLITHAMYDLMAHPEYLEPLREETEVPEKQMDPDLAERFGRPAAFG